LEQEKWVLGYYKQVSSRLASELEVGAGLGALGCSTGAVGDSLNTLDFSVKQVWVISGKEFIKLMEEPIVFLNSNPPSSRKKLANILIDRLVSLIRATKSLLHLDSTQGWTVATLVRVLIDTNRRMGFGLERNSSKTGMVGLKSCCLLSGREQIARAAL